MNEFESELDGRLAAFADRAPGGEPPSLAGRRGRRSRFGLALALVPALLLASVATVAAGVVITGIGGHSAPGIENPGQPLAGANMECMTPPQAAAFLAAHGYTDVVWQVESGTTAKDGGTSVQQATPPDHGYVVPGAILDDGKLHMVVDQRTGAVGAGICNGMPMP
jgi:hypothetical protein